MLEVHTRKFQRNKNCINTAQTCKSNCIVLHVLHDCIERFITGFTFGKHTLVRTKYFSAYRQNAIRAVTRLLRFVAIIARRLVVTSPTHFFTVTNNGFYSTPEHRSFLMRQFSSLYKQYFVSEKFVSLFCQHDAFSTK